MSEEGEKPKALLKTGRVWGLIVIAAVAGFMLGLVLFKEPWNLPAAWGDVPTWLLAALAAAAGWIGFVQLAILRQQIADEVERNKKRDELLDKQIKESERRAKSERRLLVEDVEVKFSGQIGYVVNNSRRPINDITFKVMSGFDRRSLTSAAACGEVLPAGPTWEFLPGAKQAPELETLRPAARAGFTFGNLPDGPDPGGSDQVGVAWFTDDDGYRWQLDEYQHLVESADETVYLPLKTPRPLPHRPTDAIGGARADVSGEPPGS